jgi:hypothetical protein
MIPFDTLTQIIPWIYLASIIGNWVVFYGLLGYKYGVTRGDAFWMVVLSLVPIFGTICFLVQLEELMINSAFFSTPLCHPKRPSEHTRNPR